MERRELVVFDLDHTLLRVDSHYEFAAVFLREHSRLRYTLYRIIAYEPIRKAVSYLLGDDVRRRMSVRMFRRYEKSYLRRHAEALVRDNLQQWLKPSVYSLFRQLKEKGFHIVIATASLDFIAEPIAAMLGVDVLASVYEGGRYRDDLAARKGEVIKRRYPSLTYRAFVGDSEGDICDDFADVALVVGDDLFVRSDSDRCVEVFSAKVIATKSESAGNRG